MWLSGWETKLEDFTQENPQYCSQNSHPEPLWRTKPPRSQAYLFRMGSPAAWLSGQLYLEVRVARSSVERDGERGALGTVKLSPGSYWR